MNTNIFRYKETPITFSRGESIMVNATEMAKPFGKSATHWLRNQSSQEFLSELSALRNRKGSDLVVIENGIGTWMHEDVALEFARWLSPAFAIWCNDRIKELMRDGVTTVGNDDDTILYAMQILKQRVEDKEKRVQLLQAENKAQAEEITTLQQGQAYMESILSSRATVTTTQIAQDYGYSAVAFNKLLNKMRIHHRVNGQWILYAPYLAKGYVQSRTIQFIHRDGRVDIRMNTEWTQRGRLFLYDALKENGILPIVERN